MQKQRAVIFKVALEHRRNDEMLEETKVEPIDMGLRRRMLEWFGYVKRKYETENNRAVAKMKTEGKRPRGRPSLHGNDTVRRHPNVWKIREEYATGRENHVYTI